MMNVWIFALLGGTMIGAAAGILLVYDGLTAGVSGIAAQAFRKAGTSKHGDSFWRVFFLAGLILGGWIFSKVNPSGIGSAESSTMISLVAGLLVGFGTRLSNGCTSGHGICGISRGAPRSIVATLIFMTTAILTTWLMGPRS